jgi:hypothetical protein
MSIEDTDREAAAVATAPRVSLADMEHKITGRYHFLASDAFEDDTPEVLSRLSICILVMENGFAVIGKSAPASPENFSSELGRKFAYEDAIRQLWVLEGYALRERLADA